MAPDEKRWRADIVVCGVCGLTHVSVAPRRVSWPVQCPYCDEMACNRTTVREMRRTRRERRAA